MVSFLEYLVFLEAVFCTQQLEIICRMDFDMFFGILIFDPKCDFAKAIVFPWWPILKMVSFLEYLVFLERFFAHNNSKSFVEWILTCFLEF